MVNIYTLHELMEFMKSHRITQTAKTPAGNVLVEAKYSNGVRTYCFTAKIIEVDGQKHVHFYVDFTNGCLDYCLRTPVWK